MLFIVFSQTIIPPSRPGAWTSLTVNAAVEGQGSIVMSSQFKTKGTYVAQALPLKDLGRLLPQYIDVVRPVLCKMVELRTGVEEVWANVKNNQSHPPLC